MKWITMDGVDDSLRIGVKEPRVRVISTRKYTQNFPGDKSDGRES